MFNRLILVLCSFLLVAGAYAESTAQVIYEKPANATETAIEKQLKAAGSIEAVIELINTNFHIEKSLDFVFGGDDGPLYDSADNKILIPYAFLEEVKGRFDQAKYAETGVSVEDATIDALMHTLFHELAHALIFMYELPVVGKEEDAADSLATFLLIEYFEDGQEIAISAADLFDLESDDSPELSESHFWDEHSLDAQRYYSTLCHVYGSAPEKYAQLAEDSGFSEDRAELCIDEYQQLSDSWMRILEPYMK